MLIDICEPGQSPSSDSNGGAVIGIDLGTTNSLAAISNNNIQEIIVGGDGNEMLPSIVTYEGDAAIIGDKARTDKGAVYSIKRLMGKNIQEARSIAENAQYNFVENTANGDIPTLDVNGKQVTPIEISAQILRQLKENAQRELDNIVDKAVITVPAYFDEAARIATKDAAKLAGLEVLRLINEPTAAALAYGLDNATQGIYAIYDLGGGTFDVSILKMEKGVFQVLATGGDTALGGDDFDYAIAQYWLDDIKSLHQHDIKILLSFAKKAKEFLSENDSGNWEIKLSNTTIQASLRLAQFNEITKNLVDKTINIIKNVLVDADIKRDEIQGVVMVGGSTRIPTIIDKVGEFMGVAPLTNLDPDKVVAIGAAIQAETLSKGAGSLLLDVTPLSLGLETMGDLVEVIIGRNSAIPCSAQQKFTTFKDGQNAIKIHIVQGEREMVFQCRSLAKFTLSDLPSMIAGAVVIEVTFNIDADGLLTVSATEESTGKTQHIEVKPTYGLPAQRIEEMLRDSMENAREDITTRLLAESRIEAEIMLQNIESALQEDGNLLTKEQRAEIDSQITLVKKLCAENERDQLDYQVKQLDAICADFAEKRMNQAVSSYLQGTNTNSL